MYACVKTSEDPKFKSGDEFPIVDVDVNDQYGPSLFEICAPLESTRKDGCILCYRERCVFLGGGQWEIIYNEAERG